MALVRLLTAPGIAEVFDIEAVRRATRLELWADCHTVQVDVIKIKLGYPKHA